MSGQLQCLSHDLPYLGPFPTGAGTGGRGLEGDPPGACQRNGCTIGVRRWDKLGWRAARGFWARGRQGLQPCQAGAAGRARARGCGWPAAGWGEPSKAAGGWRWAVWWHAERRGVLTLPRPPDCSWDYLMVDVSLLFRTSSATLQLGPSLCNRLIVCIIKNDEFELFEYRAPRHQ